MAGSARAMAGRLAPFAFVAADQFAGNVCRVAQGAAVAEEDDLSAAQVSIFHPFREGGNFIGQKGFRGQFCPALSSRIRRTASVAIMCVALLSLSMIDCLTGMGGLSP